MTNEAQIKALAALDGFISVMNSQGFGWIGIPALPPPVGHQGLPNYLTSYDAIIPLIQKQDRSIALQFVCQLVYVTSGHTFKSDENASVGKMGCWTLLTTEPSQLCEALLRATGKWID